jgi:hypothetical protein
MTAADEVRAMFPGHSFGAPCTEEDIRRAEGALGELLPPILRELYLSFNGFLGSTNAGFFWSLFGREGLVELNLFYRGHNVFPAELMSQCLFFGDNGCGQQWGFKRDLPGRVIQWDAEWGQDFEIVAGDPVDAWRVEKQLYDASDEQL